MYGKCRQHFADPLTRHHKARLLLFGVGWCISQRHFTYPPKWTLVADSDLRVHQHSSYHPPADPLSVTEHTLWLQHESGILCQTVFGLRRRWLPFVISSLTLNAILELSFCAVSLLVRCSTSTLIAEKRRFVKKGKVEKVKDTIRNAYA